jgi:putative transposase
MPRRKRIHIPGFLWHITHRCHKKEHLLKFEKDRKAWRGWLYKAKKRYGLRVITYAVTCNHIHLLAVDSGKDVISKSMQLLSGNTGQAYNTRKNRKGAFWEDRFYTTAIENGVHLLRCMAYIELNMVRAGAVTHPKDWEFCGYNEIIDPPRRYRLIDRNALFSSCGITDPDEFRVYYENLVAYTLQHGSLSRESLWTNSMAVGSRQYIEQNQDKFGRQCKIKALPAPAFNMNRYGQIRVKKDSDSGENAGIEDYVIKEPQSAYDADFTPVNWIQRGENSVFWNDFSLTTDA